MTSKVPETSGQINEVGSEQSEISAANDDTMELPPLTPEDHSRLCDLIDEYELAIDSGHRPDADYLCRDMPWLARHLKSTIAKLTSLDDVLNRLPPFLRPKRIGDFEVLQLLGVGSSGFVFRCRQVQPDRNVAVKVLTPLLPAEEQQERFQRELAALSAVRDDGVVTVFQSGIHEWNGVRCLWIAMELLDGGDICSFVRSQRLSEKDVLRLFRSVCVTIRSAHRLGILHRDLKPSNILMNSLRLPKIVDFGIARVPAASAAVHATETGLPGHRGTVAWSAPELLNGTPDHRADIRSEIFSLGVVLFELLSGSHPYNAELHSIPQIAVRIASNQRLNISEIAPALSVDSCAVVNQMLMIAPEARYQNLDEVIEEIDRICRDEPVLARKVSLREQFLRWCRLHRTSVLVASVLMIAAAAILSTALISAASVKRQANLLQLANQELSQNRDELVKSSKLLTETLRMRERSIRNGLLSTLQRTVQASPRQVQSHLNSLDAFPVDSRCVAWKLLNDQSMVEVVQLPSGSAPVHHLHFRGQDRRLYSVDGEGVLRIYDLTVSDPSQSPFETSTVRLIGTAGLQSITSDSVLIGVNTDLKFVEIKANDGRQERILTSVSAAKSAFAISPDGEWIGGVDRERTPFLLNRHEDRLIRLQMELRDHPAGVWFSPDSQVLNLVDNEGRRHQWSTTSGELMAVTDVEERVRQQVETRTRKAVFALDMAEGEVVAMGRSNGWINVFHPFSPTGRVNFISLNQNGRLNGMQLIPPFQLLTVTDVAQLHNLYAPATDSQSEPMTVPVLLGKTQCAIAIDDCKRVVVGGIDGSIAIANVSERRIPARSLNPFEGIPNQGFGQPVSLLPIPRLSVVIAGHRSGWLSVSNAITGKGVAAIQVCDGPVNGLHAHPSEPNFAVGYGGTKPGIRIFRLNDLIDLMSRDEQLLRPCPDAVFQLDLDTDVRVVRFTNDGQHLIVACRNGKLLKFDCQLWKEISAAQAHVGGIFTMDTQRKSLISGGTDGFIRTWSTTELSMITEWKAHEGRVRNVLLLRDGTQIASAALDGKVRIWTLEGRLLHELIGHSGAVVGLALSNDQQTLVSGGDDGQILVWDAVTGDLQLRIAGHHEPITDLKFTPDSNQMISTGLDGNIFLWGHCKSEFR